MTRSTTAHPSQPLQRAKSPEADDISDRFEQALEGSSVRFKHPEKGEIVSNALGAIRYAELWQRRKSPQEPWVETGNLFTSLWTKEGLLYAWKGRIFLLDSFEAVTDADIKRQFLEPAQRFGLSDETASVNFAYPPGSWLITDIGKFRVGAAKGIGLRLSPGAVGRFIHASGGSGLENRVLVVEDYLEGGGGQDTVWKGWQLSWSDILDID